MIDIKERRLPATVTSVFYGKEDHGVLTAYVMLEFGGEQGFGGLALDERTGHEFKRQIVSLFGWTGEEVDGRPNTPGDAWEKLVGRHCFALRCWDEWNARIDGLEVDGKRFLISKFRREMWPELQVSSEFEQMQDRIIREITWATRRVQEQVARLARLKEDYYDWEKAP